MSDRSAIQATFSDFKLIRGRKVAQIICEVPIEAADKALETLGGLPRPDREAWIALAALNVTSIKPQKERRPFEELESGLQAILRCKQPAFWRFLADRYAYEPDNEGDAAEAVREICGVTSRSALNLDPKAAARWQSLDAEYMVWMRAPQHA